MTMTIDMEGLRQAERERVLAVIDTAQRNRAIRTRYADLMPRIGSLAAIGQLADDYYRSERQIRRIIYE